MSSILATRRWREYTLTLAGDGIWRARLPGSGRVIFSGRTPEGLARAHRRGLDKAVADFQAVIDSGTPSGYPPPSEDRPLMLFGYPVAPD